ncbi:MAG TPA: hypothetical protein VJH34_00155 [archaeon]|nr:hypothetical protein [archaeon]
MGKSYRPDYAKGEILVMLSYDSKDLASIIGRASGYELVDKWEYGEGVYVYKVPAGKEAEACKYFQSLNLKKMSFVEWAARRDAKFERRINSINMAKNMLNILYDKVDVLSDDDFSKRARFIAGYLERKPQK